MRAFFSVLLLLLVALPGRAQALDEPVDELTPEQLDALADAYQAYADSVTGQFTWHTGVVDLGDGIGTLTIPDGFRYLGPEDASAVLVDLWGNPPSDTWGMLFPIEVEPMDENSWAVEISYSEDGFVDDSDAADIDYDDLLATMQDDTAAESEYRIEQGYPAIALVGWARSPYYDGDTRKLHWAKELQFGDMAEHTLNYNIRVLGRKGVLVLNAIGSMDDADSIIGEMEPIMASASFNDGYRYEDFDPEYDKVAAYGVAGLVAGKVLAKAGIFAALLKFWKVLAIGTVTLFSVLRRRLFGSKPTGGTA
jgi:uncharacterized membrane-anchored protein